VQSVPRSRSMSRLTMVKWWQWALVALAGFLIIGLVTGGPALIINPIKSVFDKPDFTQDEVIAISKRVLSNKYPNYSEGWFEGASPDSTRITYDVYSLLSDFSATYVGEGKWKGNCIRTVSGGLSPGRYNIGWYFYEKSQTVEFFNLP